MCELCKVTGKNWAGDDPKCGFINNAGFTEANWNCATLNRLRELSDDHNLIQYCDDTSLVTIKVPPTPDKNGGWVVMHWYKCRGCVAYAVWISDRKCVPLTEEIALRAIKVLEEMK